VLNRIQRKFRQLKKEGKKAFIVFLTAGYPDLAATERLILALDKIGVDIIEIGVPFSDPLADGAVIQQASQLALEKGAHLGLVLGLVRRLRKHTQIPLCLMSYYNPIFVFGEERFSKEASRAGVDGVIIPDLPVEEARGLKRYADKYNLDTIFFISPTTSQKRMKRISKASGGFIYYVSLTGVTGARQELSVGLMEHLKMVKKITNKPVCAGFGISTSSQVKAVSKVADGVIVGSAIIRKIMDNIGKPDLSEAVSRFVLSLKT
jgi:tryptophan synthase alpha chain